MRNILVSGCNSGLGRYCYEKFQAQGLHRNSDFRDFLRLAEQQPFDAIIHCAWNTNAATMKNNFQQYLNDTLILTEKLLTLPTKLFVFISTIDVYPLTNTFHDEEECIDISQIKTVYGQMKYVTEQYIQSKTKNFLIIRPSALLGEYAKPNSLMKILSQDKPTLSLSEKSEFNYVLHADLAEFIALAMEQDIRGIYNFVAQDNITLAQVCEKYARKADFGSYEYQTQAVSTDKIDDLKSGLLKTSVLAIEQFIKNQHRQGIAV